MDLGYFPLAFPPGLCPGAPLHPYPRRGDGCFLELGTVVSAASPAPPAYAGAAEYATAPPAASGPGYRPCRAAGLPDYATSILPGNSLPPPPSEPSRPCPGPGAGELRLISSCLEATPAPSSPTPAAPRTFEWMRAKRSPPGRSEWGGGRGRGLLLSRLPSVPLLPRSRSPPRSLLLPPLKRGVFRRCRRRGAVRRGTSRLPRAHQLQHPAAHGAGEGVSLQPVPVAGSPPRGGPLAAPPRRPGEGLVPEPPHEAEEAGAGGAGRPRRRAHGCPGRPRLRSCHPPRRDLPGTSGSAWKLRPAEHSRRPLTRDRCDCASLIFFFYCNLSTVLFMKRCCCC